MKPPPPIEIQIHALLSGGAFRLAQEWSSSQSLTGGEYAKVFTVARQDVLRYVEAHGFPAGCFSERPGSSDGPYMIQDNGQYVVYVQERGIPFSETVHASRREADAAMVNLLLGLSGTGLYASTTFSSAPDA